MAGGNNLIKEIGGLLIESQITKFVDDQGGGLGVSFEMTHQRVIDLRCEQTIQHVHGSGEQNALIGLVRTPADDFSQEGLPDAGIADKHDAGAFLKKFQIKQADDAVLRLDAALWCLKWKLSMEWWECSRDMRKRRSMARRVA